MGFSSVIALVIGSQIGSGVFMLPASLALIGPISLFGWLISGSGAILLALVFAQLCMRVTKSGGPHAYVESAFGKSAAFFVGWTYWLVSWISSIAVIIATIGYLSPLLGITSPTINLFLEILLLFIVTLINLRGVAFAGSVEFILTILKCIPLLVIPIVGLIFFKPDHFHGIAAKGTHVLGSINKASLITLWGFIGLETVTVASGAVKNPKKIIPRAVVLGTLVVAFIYVLNSIGIMGVIPPESLANESAPYATASHIMFGSWCNAVVCIIASIACLGTLNAWVLTSGQIAYGAAKDGLFPQILAKTNKRSSPYVSMLAAFFGSIPFLILTVSDSLVTQLNTIIDISVTTFLGVYIVCIISFMALLRKEQSKHYWLWSLSILSLAFCLWALCSVSFVHLLLSSFFVLSGLPIYLSRYKKIRTEKASSTDAL